MSSGLSVDDVIARLFAPTTNLPVRRSKQAIVVVAKGMEHAVTHSEIEGLIQSALAQLKARNIKKGDNIVFCSENRLEYSPTLFACWALQASATLIDYRMAPAEVLNACKMTGAKLLIASKAYSNMTNDKNLESEPLEVMNIADISNSKNKFDKVPIDFQSIDMDQPLLALFTSGTTGAPKTAMHTLRSLARNIVDLADTVGMQENMTAVTPLPVSHVFGLSVLLVTQVLGMKTVLTALDPINFIMAVHQHKPHLIAALPQFYGALLSAPKGTIDLTNTELLLCGGAPLMVSLAEKFEEAFSKRINNGYGSTESKLVALNKDGPVMSVGKAVGTVKIDVIDKQGANVPDGKFGEVRVSSATLMDGYLNDTEKTKKVLSNEQYKTGDYGCIKDGNLFVVGRISDTVIVGGVVVEAGEVEAALRNNRQVKEVAVTAVSNKRLGQVIKASVVLLDDEIASKLRSTNEAEKRDAKLSLVREFKEFCTEHLPRYKRPMIWEFLGPHNGLPKTLAGKIDKKSIQS